MLKRDALRSIAIKIFPIVFIFIILTSIVFSIAHLDFIFNVLDLIYWFVSFVIVVALSLLWFVFLPTEIIVEKRGLLHVEFSELDLSRGRREIIIAALVAGAFISFRYIIFPYPQGWDTAYYLYHLKKLVSDFNYVFSLPRQRIFAFLIMYMINLVFINPELTIMITPVIFAMLFVVGVVSFVWEVTGDHELGFYAGVISAVTFSTSRLFLDLYCNFMAWTFTMFALLYVARIVKRPEPSVKNLTIFSAFSFLIAFIHPWTLFVYLGIIFVFMLILLLFMRREAIGIIAPLFVSLIPTIVAAFSEPRIALYLIRSIFFSYVRYPLELSEREDPLIAFAALLGAFYLLTIRKKTVLHGIILAWYITISFLFATGAYTYSYRLLNLMPMGILAAFGLRYLTVEVPKYMGDDSGKLGFIKRWFKYRSKLLVSILLIIIVITALPNSYLPDHVNRPSQYYMSQLEWISSHFGFENKSIVVLINKPVPMANFPQVGNYLDWAVSELGQVVYPGSLLDYIQGVKLSIVPQKPFYFPKLPNYVPDLILIPDRWYVLSSFELVFAREINGTGVYVINYNDLHDFEYVLANVSRRSFPVLNASFSSSSAFNISYINNATSFFMNFTALSKGSKLVLDIYTYPIIYDYVVLDLSGPNTTALDIVVSLWSNDTMVDVKRVNDYFRVDNSSVYVNLLTFGHPCNLIRFEIKGLPSALGKSFELTINKINAF